MVSKRKMGATLALDTISEILAQKMLDRRAHKPNLNNIITFSFSYISKILINRKIWKDYL